MEQHSKRQDWTNLLWSVLLIAGGILLLLHNLDLFELGSIWKFLPIILIAVGFEKILRSTTLDHRISGFWWIFMGSWLFLNLNKFLGFTFKSTWPLILIAWGITLLWRNMKRP